MKSLRPSGPSIEVRRALFGAESNAGDLSLVVLAQTFALRWLAPSMGCLLLTLMATAPSGVASNSSDQGEPMIMADLSGSNRSFYARVPLHYEFSAPLVAPARISSTRETAFSSSSTSLTNNGTNQGHISDHE